MIGNGPSPLGQGAAGPLVSWASSTPSGAGYDLVLLAHVACVLVGLGTVVVSGVQASRLSRLPAGRAVPETLSRYYSPGVNWAGRVLYGVPVLGAALLGLSHGAYRLSDGWVLGGLVLWALGAGAAELWLWPAERRLQAAVTGAAAGGAAGTVTPAGAVGAGVHADRSATPGPAVLGVDLVRREARLVGAAATGLVAILVGVSVLMVAQP